MKKLVINGSETKVIDSPMPLISIGMLVYNHEKYISDALEGLLSQTYQRMELVILDDASTDKTVDIIEMYMPRLKRKFERIIFQKNIKNCGNIPYNCNIIEKQIRGKFYFSVSGDDIILPDCITLLYDNLITHPECSLIHANAISIQEDFRFGDTPDDSLLLHKDWVTRVEPEMMFHRLMRGNIVAATTVLLRSEIFNVYGYHDEAIAFEDYEFWLRLSLKEKFFYLNQPVVLYRRGDSSATQYGTDGGEKRLRVAIHATYETRKKYIGLLSEVEQDRCWETFYVTYMGTCRRFGYKDAISDLEHLLTRIGCDVTRYDIVLKGIFERQKREEYLLKQWRKVEKDSLLRIERYVKENGVRSLAIYGYSRLGRMLRKKLFEIGIDVTYIIDKKGSMLDAPLPVYTLDDVLPHADLVIVAPPGLIREVSPMIKEKISALIWDLEELVMEQTM